MGVNRRLILLSRSGLYKSPSHQQTAVDSLSSSVVESALVGLGTITPLRPPPPPPRYHANRRKHRRRPRRFEPFGLRAPRRPPGGLGLHRLRGLVGRFGKSRYGQCPGHGRLRGHNGKLSQPSRSQRPTTLGTSASCVNGGRTAETCHLVHAVPGERHGDANPGAHVARPTILAVAQFGARAEGSPERRFGAFCSKSITIPELAEG
jgi:hypothetical protein